MPSKSKQSSSGSRLKWRIILPIILIFGPWGGFWLWDYYKLLSGQTPMFDVAIKLKVGDEIVEINRTVPCLEITEGELLPYLFQPWQWHQRPFRYFSRDMSTGAELQDGRSVMVTIPTACDLVQEARKSVETGNLLPEGFMPIVALVDDADDPQVLKLIVSRSYYRKPEREIELLDYRLSPSPSGSFPNFRDKFNWLRSQGPASAEIGYSKTLSFSRKYLGGMPLEAFRASNPAAVPVDGLSVPTSLFDLPDFKFPEGLERPTIRGWGIFGFPFFSLGAEKGPLDKETSYDHIVPVFKTPEGDSYDPNEKGYLLLYRKNKPSEKPGEILEWSEDGRSILSRTRIRKHELVKDGVNIDMKSQTICRGSKCKIVRQPYFYDPNSKYIYWLSSRTVTFPDLR